jgi:transcriptional regulator with XRE-family HTH domain
MEKSFHCTAYRTLITSLRQSRRRLGLGQREVAHRVGVSRTWVQKIEQHELRLDILHLIRMCRALGLDAHELVREMERDLPP